MGHTCYSKFCERLRLASLFHVNLGAEMFARFPSQWKKAECSGTCLSAQLLVWLVKAKCEIPSPK
jgi:hypothetical protein